MLTYVATFLFFTAVLASPKVREDVAYPFLETTRSAEKIVKFRALGKDINLRLEPAGQFIADDFAVVEGVDGEVEYSRTIKSVKEKMYRDRMNQAALHVDDDGPLKIYGIVNHNLKIEPIEPEKLDKDGRIAHKIVEQLKSKHTRNDAIAPKLKNVATYREYSWEDYKCTCIIIEILFVTDSKLTTQFKTREKLESYLAYTIVGMQNLYDTLGIVIELKMMGVIMYTKYSEPKFIKDNEFPDDPNILNTDNLLDDFAMYYYNEAINLPRGNRMKKLIYDADSIMFITPRKLGYEDGSFAAGVAYMGGICELYFKYALCQNDNDYNEAIDTFAHELGHHIGMPHDGDPPVPSIGSLGAVDCPKEQGHLMSYERNSVNQTSFSSCSSNNVENFLTLGSAYCIIESCYCEFNQSL